MKLWIGIYGEVIGLVSIALVSLWDFIITGARGFFEYNVGPKGIILIWLGLVLILASKHIDRVTK